MAKDRGWIKEEDCLRGIGDVRDQKDLLVMPVLGREFELGTLYNYTNDSILGIKCFTFLKSQCIYLLNLV